jgi:hypothetical protein
MRALDAGVVQHARHVRGEGRSVIGLVGFVALPAAARIDGDHAMRPRQRRADLRKLLGAAAELRHQEHGFALALEVKEDSGILAFSERQCSTPGPTAVSGGCNGPSDLMLRAVPGRASVLQAQPNQGAFRFRPPPTVAA